MSVYAFIDGGLKMAKAKEKKDAKKTPCEAGDTDLTPWTLNVKPDSRIDFTAHICFANARFRLWLEMEPSGPAVLLLDQSGASKITTRLPDLLPGRYQLFWSFLTPSEKWQTRTQIDVDASLRFLRRKNSSGNNPIQMGSVGLQVSL